MCFLAVEGLCNANTSQITCESFGEFYYTGGGVKACKIIKSSIDSEEITISPNDESVQGISFWNNRKIKFLPIKVAETFANLLVYYAGYCSLTTIKKENFAGLKKVKVMNLNYNRISTIYDGTFEDMIALEQLFLRE